MHESRKETGTDIVESAVQHSYNHPIDLCDSLRNFLGRHREDDAILTKAHETVERISQRQYASERRKCDLILMHADTILHVHPVGGPFLQMLHKRQERVRQKTIDLIRDTAD